MSGKEVSDRSGASSGWVAILAFSLFAWTMSNLDQSLFSYAIPGVMGEFKVGLDTIGLILTVGFIAAAIMVVFAGLAADTWGRRWTLAGLLALSAACVGLSGLVTDLTQLTVLRALAFGLAAGLAPSPLHMWPRALRTATAAS